MRVKRVAPDVAKKYLEDYYWKLEQKLFDQQVSAVKEFSAKQRGKKRAMSFNQTDVRRSRKYERKHFHSRTLDSVELNNIKTNISNSPIVKRNGPKKSVVSHLAEASVLASTNLQPSLLELRNKNSQAGSSLSGSVDLKRKELQTGSTDLKRKEPQAGSSTDLKKKVLQAGSTDLKRKEAQAGSLNVSSDKNKGVLNEANSNGERIRKSFKRDAYYKARGGPLSSPPLMRSHSFHCRKREVVAVKSTLSVDDEKCYLTPLSSLNPHSPTTDL